MSRNTAEGMDEALGERSLAGPVVTATGTYQAASPQRGSASPRRCSLGVSFPVRDHIRSVSFGLFVTPHGLRLLTLFLHRWNAARTSVAKSSSSSTPRSARPCRPRFSLDERNERLPLLDNKRGELCPVPAADVPHRVDRFGRDY